jgi:hypothetical protein
MYCGVQVQYKCCVCVCVGWTKIKQMAKISIPFRGRWGKWIDG